MTATPTAFELINPSDQVTFEADSFEAAALATLLVGRGSYGAKPLAGEGDEVPLFLFGGLDHWLAQRFPSRSFEDLLNDHREAIARCLRTFLVGNREDFEQGAKHAPDRVAFLAEWNDRKRTSMNDICGRAAAVADAITKASDEGPSA